MKKYFKTTIQIEILSEVKYNSTDLEQINYDITEGHCSGVVNVKGYEELTPEQAAKALLAQGSDPEFFNLTVDGEPLEEDDWTRDYSEERDHKSYQDNDLVELTRVEESIWKELRTDFEDDGLIHVDAWTSEDDNESGMVIAKINASTGEVTYIDERAKTDKKAQEVILKRVWEICEAKENM